MTHDKKSCIKVIVVWILVIILLIISQFVKGEEPQAPISNENNLIVEEIKDERPDKINQYFESKGMPLAGTGETFVKEADEHKIDWRLLAAISVQESTGGKRMIPGTYNAFGWNSGHYTFESFEDAIAYISDKFESGKYYIGKDSVGILKTYNPPSVNKNYPNEVLAIMVKIGE